ncbi:MAG: TolC family protein [Melioribacteraceae bacterium]
MKILRFLVISILAASFANAQNNSEVKSLPDSLSMDTIANSILIRNGNSIDNLSLSLKDAIEISLKNSDKIRQYEMRLEQKEDENLAAWSNFLPSIDLEWKYTHLNDPLSIDLDPIRQVIIQMQSSNQAEITNIYGLLSGKPALTADQKKLVASAASDQLNGLLPPFSETLKKQDYKTAAFIGVQPLFVGGKLIAAKKYAASEEEYSRLELTKIKNDVTNETIKYYLQTILMQEVVKTRIDVVDGIRMHRNDAQKLFDEGLIANYHLLRAEVAVAEAERNLTKDQNSLATLMVALKINLGIDSEEKINLSDSLVYSEIQDSLKQLTNSAIDNNPLLKMIGQKRIAAAQKYNSARSEFLPKIAAFARYDLYPEYLSALEPRWAVGVSAQINLFHGFRDYLNLQSANKLEDEVSFLEADAIKKVTLQTTNFYNNLITASSDYKKLNATLNLAQENLRQNDKRFHSGLGTSLEVIDAQLSLEKVKLDRLSALYNYFSFMSEIYTSNNNIDELIRIWNIGENK